MGLEPHLRPLRDTPGLNMPATLQSPPPKTYRFSIEDYLEMERGGILAPDERLELIDGQVVPMSPIGNRHVASVLALDLLLRRQVPESIRVVVQNAVNIQGHTQVQPDIALVSLAENLWENGISAADCRLVIEVAEASLAQDRGRKLEVYARAGIPEYWVVDLVSRQVEVYREPRGGSYRRMERVGVGQDCASDEVPSVRVAVEAVVPPGS